VYIECVEVAAAAYIVDNMALGIARESGCVCAYTYVWI